MVEYIGEEKYIKEGDVIPLTITNKCESPVAVGTGFIFRKDGTYIVNVKDNKITISNYYG